MSELMKKLIRETEQEIDRLVADQREMETRIADMRERQATLVRKEREARGTLQLLRTGKRGGGRKLVSNAKYLEVRDHLGAEGASFTAYDLADALGVSHESAKKRLKRDPGLTLIHEGRSHRGPSEWVIAESGPELATIHPIERAS